MVRTKLDLQYPLGNAFEPQLDQKSHIHHSSYGSVLMITLDRLYTGMSAASQVASHTNAAICIVP